MSNDNSKAFNGLLSDTNALANRAKGYKELAAHLPANQKPIAYLEGNMSIITTLGKDLITNFLDQKK